MLHPVNHPHLPSMQREKPRVWEGRFVTDVPLHASLAMHPLQHTLRLKVLLKLQLCRIPRVLSSNADNTIDTERQTLSDVTKTITRTASVLCMLGRTHKDD